MNQRYRKTAVLRPLQQGLQNLCAVAAALGMALCTSATASAQTLVPQAAIAAVQTDAKSPEQTEYELKAAFIYNFMRFIEWPPEKQLANRQHQQQSAPHADKTKTPPPMVIGILGKNPFGNAFDPVLNKKISERSIQLIAIESFEPYLKDAETEAQALAAYRDQNAAKINRCDMLFFCGSEARYIEKLLPLTELSATVTVSDIFDFAARGGMIGFVMENNKVRFDINVAQCEKENIKVRSQLLELARQVFKKEPLKP